MPPTPGDDNHGLFAGGKLASSKGLHGLAGGHHRPGGIRQRQIRLSQCLMSPRGATQHGFQPQACKRPLKDSGLHSIGQSAMDYGGSGVYKRIGCHHGQEVGVVFTNKAKHVRSQLSIPRQSPAKAQSKEKREGGRKMGQQCSGPTTGARGLKWHMKVPYEPEGGGGPVSNPLTSQVTFLQWMTCLPRWILQTRTKLASCLARSFAILRRSSETASALFPLPLPSLDCFRGSGPGLSCRRLKSVCRDRLLNIWTLVLDFLFLGRWPSNDELRRRPSNAQEQVFHRLRTLGRF